MEFIKYRDRRAKTYLAGAIDKKLQILGSCSRASRFDRGNLRNKISKGRFKMKTINLFQIIDFSSIPAGQHQSGFSIILHKDFAEAVRNVYRDPSETVTQGMEQRIALTFGKAHLVPNAVQWVGATWLLQSVRVGGECACFGSGFTDPNEMIVRHVRFDPHNLDNPLQAAAVLSVWLFWFNTISTLTEFELPFCV